MFNIEFLHVIRESEYANILSHLSAGARILEIGGGTGYQAKRLAGDGYIIDSIDIYNSNYVSQSEFPIKTYDGRHIPFPDKSFDIIFSSNVLEHVSDLPYLQIEIKRVLRAGGYCVHLMPSGSWRNWTNIAHYMEFIQQLFDLTLRLVSVNLTKYSFHEILHILRLMVGTTRQYAIVPRHGESGNALLEIWTFSSWHWIKHFSQHGFKIEKVKPMNLFYTGHMIFGPKLSLNTRQWIARWVGSACTIYVVRPK